MRRLTYGAVANGISQAVNIASQLVLVPLFLTFWGSSRYGEWLTLSAAVSYLAMLDAGVQTYVINQLTKFRASGEDAAYMRVLNSALALVGAVSLAAAAVAVLVAGMLPVERWMGSSSPGIRLAVALLALQVIVSLPQGIVTGIYRTAGEYAVEQMIGNARKVLALLLTAGALVAGGGFVAVAGLHLLALLLTCGFAGWDIARRHRWISFEWRLADRGTAFSLLGPSSFFLVMQLWAGIAIQGSTLVVGSLHGTAAVAVFVSLRTLVNLVKQVTGTLQNALWPELTALEARGRMERLRQVHLMTAKLLMMSSACAAIFLYIAGEDIVRVWTGGRLAYDAGVMLALIVLLTVQAFWSTSAVVMSATNNHRKIAMWTTISGVTGLVAGYWIGHTMGTAGVIYGMAAADLVICGYFVPRAACRHLDQSLRVFVAEVAGRGAIAAVALIASVYVLSPFLHQLTFVPRLMAWGVVLATLTALVSYVAVMNAYERQWALARAGSLQAVLMRKCRGITTA